jgi:hypothetical protein
MVFKYQSTTPTWLYQQPALTTTTLLALQKELKKLFFVTKKFCLVPYTSTYMEFHDISVVSKICPQLIGELHRLGLHLKLIAFISVVIDRNFPAHVDVSSDIALNIPLINCKGTHTVWYDGNIIQKEAEDYLIGAESARNARESDPHSLIEIGRCDADIPHWINVNILHRPETSHNQLRVAASMRFDPEPLDEYGNLWPHLIK